MVSFTRCHSFANCGFETRFSGELFRFYDWLSAYPENPPAVATALRCRFCSEAETAAECRGYSRTKQIAG